MSSGDFIHSVKNYPPANPDKLLLVAPLLPTLMKIRLTDRLIESVAMMNFFGVSTKLYFEVTTPCRG